MQKPTLTLEMNIVSDVDKKVLFQTRVSMETISKLAAQHGEAGVQRGIWDMFQKVTSALRPK